MQRLHLPINNPCHEDWSAMERESESRRFCESCSKQVHDVSAMTEREARELLRSAGQKGRVCVRYTTDADGQIKFRPETARATASMGFSASWLAAASLTVGLLSGCADGEPTRVEADQCVYEVGPWSFEAPRGEGSCPPVGDATIVAPPEPDTQVVGAIEAVPTMGEAPAIDPVPEIVSPTRPEPNEHVTMGKIAAPTPTEHVKMGDVAAVPDVPCDTPQPGTTVTPAPAPAEDGPRRL